MTLGTVMKEKDEETALFFEMRRLEKERSNHLLLHNSDEFDAPLGSKPGSSPIFKIVSSPHARRTDSEDFLNSDDDKNDYDWLLTPPGTPLFPSLEMESQKTAMSQIGTLKALPTALKPRLVNPQLERASRGNSASRQPIPTPGSNSCSADTHRPSSSGGTGSTASRSATPTGRFTLSASAKPLRTSTPTSRASLPSSKPMAPPARSSTRSARSSTPTARPTLPAPKATSRSAAPTSQASIPSSLSSVSAPPSRSSSVTKLCATTRRNPVTARCSSTMKSRPNLRTLMPERPVSASRGRPRAPNSQPSSIEACSNGKPNRQSCFPSSGWTPNGNIPSNGRSISTVNRAHSNGSDDVSPVLIGTKMVERIINMRKLAPPKQDGQHPTGKSSSSQDSSGFGRTLSKKSLEMALRHMDIRRSLPASPMYSVRSGQARNRTVSFSDSPLTTSSNASSELSTNSNTLNLNGSEVEDDDLGSERGECHPPLPASASGDDPGDHSC